jgi:hypothetical protein
MNSWINPGAGAHDIFSGVQDPAVRDPGVRPGERFSDTLIRRSEEAYIQERLREERVAAGIPVDEEPATNRTMEAEESEFEEEYVSFFETLVFFFREFFSPFFCLLTHMFSTLQDTESEDEEQMRENLTDARAGHGSGDGRPVEPAGEERTQPSEGVLAEETTSDSQYLSPAELADKMEDFTRVMQEKFLSGMDSEHVDYALIDNDAALDDDWMPEITRDAEEKYFEED